MMTVYYGGSMIGHHVVGRRGIKLVPGPNKVTYEIGQALIDAEIAVEMKDEKKRQTASSEHSETMEAAADEDEATKEV